MAQKRANRGPSLTVTKQSKTGKNTEFRNDQTGEIFSLAKVLSAIEKGKYPDYHPVKPSKGTKFVRSNPDRNKRNNLG